jgi:hypothetical protein
MQGVEQRRPHTTVDVLAGAHDGLSFERCQRREVSDLGVDGPNVAHHLAKELHARIE